MMKLKKLEISGFKSFVDPISLHFAAGVTGIVGPNGCGKSNLSDAISWVLGEQSAKSLRSGTMEDVIFNGSERRKPLGMAEVVLTLEADGSVEDAVDGELVISRRVYRGGEGQYRLNGRRVRLKEIRDLLMGTGLGIRAYSIIEQGKIGLILSGKPQERRKLLEEAAGVTRYKQRRRIAELKLEEATANLLRLEDIISEVERALRSLKRQASAARRYAAKKQEYGTLLDAVLLGRWHRLESGREELRRALAERTDADAELVAEVHRLEATLATKREELDDLSRGVADLHQKDAELAARIEGRQALVQGAQENLEQIAERRASGQATAAERRRRADDDRKALVDLASQRGDLTAEFQRAEQEVQGDRSAISERSAGLGDAERQVTELREQILKSLADLNAARSESHRQTVECEKAALRRSHLEEERRDHGRELAENQESLTAASQRVQELEHRLTATRDDREARSAELDQELTRETELGHRVQESREQVSTLKRRLDVLGQLDAAQREGRESLLRRLEELGHADVSFLGDRTRAPRGWGRTIDFFLDRLSEAVLVPAGADPLEIADALRESQTPAILLTEVPAPQSDLPGPRDPAIVGNLAESLELPPELARAFPPTYLVKTAEQAERLARLHPGAAFASREGLWARGGFLHVEGGREVPGVLERRQEMQSLHSDLPDLEKELESAEASLEAAVEERTRRAEEIHRLDDAISETQRELAVAQARQEDIAARIRRLEKEGASFDREARRLEEEMTRFTAESEGAGRRAEALQVGHANLEKQFEMARGVLDEARHEREQLRAEGAARQGRLDLLAERLRGLDHEKSRLEREIAGATEFLARWDEEAAALETREERLRGSVTQAERELAEALAARDGSQESILAAQEVLDEHRKELRALEGRVEEQRRLREESRSRVEELRVRLAEMQGEEQHLRELYREHLGAELPAEVSPPEGDLDEMEERLVDTKAALERLGPVNELAGQEYEEHQERHEFLQTQRADVSESVARLKRTIQEINQTSSERFRKTFAEVNEKFGEVFVSLFGGGEAEMRLQDEEDVLESGIEIVARPPGKRLQNLLLLSGGEKALTAIALLMALFHTKASPFCILDEVDAPLDDPNTARFVQIIQKMSQDTQFIVITHNKLTMQAASTLYGVTMQERGVSKTVSVTLDDVQPESQLVSA